MSRPTSPLCTADLASVFRSAIERGGMRLVVNCPPLPRGRLRGSRHVGEDRPEPALSNAFKFTFAGDIAVRLEPLAATRTHRARYRHGHPGDELPHIFERFHRIAGARTHA